MSPQQPCVLAAVHPGQSPVVVRQAAAMAAAFGMPLVCAYVNPARYVVLQDEDGSELTAPVDPDFEDDADASFPPELAVALGAELAGTGVPWRTLLLAGEPADALEECANLLDAQLLVVGTHANPHATMRELLGRSLAARLARGQGRPVLVVPVHRPHPSGGHAHPGREHPGREHPAGGGA